MIIYVNGDSHSYGHDAGGPEFSYGNIIAKNLYAKFICDAVSGCDNASIILRTTDFLTKITPDYIVIGWTSWEREAWHYQDKVYYVTSSGHDMLPQPLQLQYKEWVIRSTEPDFRYNKQVYWHNQIYNFHKFLESKQIKHLFFNCYSVFNHINERYDWNNNYIDPYKESESYYFWLEDKGFSPINQKFYHYGPDAHRAWADHLLLKIKSDLTII